MKKIKNKTITLGIMIYALLSCKSIDNSCPPPLSVFSNYDCRIDWENYNNVELLYVCNNLECSDPKVILNNGRNIKVYGWLVIDSNNKIGIKASNSYDYNHTIPIDCTIEIQTIVGTYDLTRKCYLNGELKLEKVQDGKGSWCCQMDARIVLKNIDNIYFE